MQPNFFQSGHCRPNGIYCQVCRMRDEPAHRAALLAKYPKTPVQSVDFDCPKGVVWDCGAAKPRPLCLHLGGATGQLLECDGCRGKVQLKVFTCQEFGLCTIYKPHSGAGGCCNGCEKYEAIDVRQRVLPGVRRLRTATDAIIAHP